MPKKNIKKRYLTLIEMMIVIVLIGLIGGVIAYNMRGSLEEGKMCKTQLGGAQVYNILMLDRLNGTTKDYLQQNWTTVVRNSPFAKDGERLVFDGWGEQYQIQVTEDDILVESKKYTELYNKRNNKSEKQYLK